MPHNSYRFVTRWKIPGSISKVYAILNDVSGYPRWWPSLAHSFERLHEGNGDGRGAKGRIVTKGFLPYVIRWNYEVVSSHPPHGFDIRATGDLAGEGAWTLKQNGDSVDVTYLWNVRGEKPLLRLLSPILKPLFALNHDWVMKRGHEGLEREMKRTITA